VRGKVLLMGVILILFSLVSVNAFDIEAKYGVGLEGGLGKPVLTDQSMKLGYHRGFTFRYGLSNNVALGTIFKIASTKEDKSKGFKYTDYLLEGVLYYFFTKEDRKFNPYILGGAGISIWKYRDSSGHILRSDYFGVKNRADSSSIRMKDQEIAFLGGAGVEYYLTEKIGVNVGARFHYLTHLLTSWTGGKDVVGDWPGEIDLVNGLPEAFLGVTYYLGRGKDQDKDRVPDRKDKCPDTPKGCKVDEVGCPIDLDGDGVCDGLDSCAGTPQGATVDAKGCPSDADGDGVFDGIDKCADTPKGVKVDKVGCPLDTDGDGVADYLDKCADTPKGCVVDNNGCPLDADKDGVCDGLDKCPDTPAGIAVDAEGCPLAKPIEEKILLYIKWGPGLAIDEENKKTLDDLAERLKVYKDVKIEVGGYTDDAGAEEDNIYISQARANAVKKYLVSKGVEALRVTFKGYGPVNFLEDNSTAEGRAKNRRIEIVKIK
jgi:opacity protein-like surface antigen